MIKSFLKIISFRIISFLVFLGVLLVSNLLISAISNPIYTNVIYFLNSNILLILVLAFLGLINELFWNFSFPFILPAPIISAIYSVYIILFLQRLWALIDLYIIQLAQFPFDLIYSIVPIIVLVAGYIVITLHSGKPFNSLESRRVNLEESRKNLEKKMEKVNRKIEKLTRKK